MVDVVIDLDVKTDFTLTSKLMNHKIAKLLHYQNQNLSKIVKTYYF